MTFNDAMQIVIFGLIVAAVLVLGAVIVVPRLGRARVEATVFTAPPLGLERPSDVGVAYDTLAIPVTDHTLQAWFAPVPNPRASLLFFHGQNDALSSLVPVFDRLHQQQIAVMAFNYSGHGESTGNPTIEGVRADCAAAYAVFRARVTPGPTFVLGYSLGAGVMLDALSHRDMDVTGVILASPFASIRSVAVADGMPAWLSFIIPDAYNNVRAVAASRHPVLVVQSETDGTFPLSMAQQVHAANPTAELSVVPSPLHAEVIASRSEIGDRADAYWQAIFDFVKRHTQS